MACLRLNIGRFPHLDETTVQNRGMDVNVSSLYIELSHSMYSATRREMAIQLSSLFRYVQCLMEKFYFLKN